MKLYMLTFLLTPDAGDIHQSIDKIGKVIETIPSLVVSHRFVQS